MKAAELTDKVCAWARTRLVTKAKSGTVKFLIGASTVGVGRQAIGTKIAAFSQMCADGDGEIDMAALRESLLGGFEAEPHIPILGGIVTLDKTDAEDFFAWVSAGEKGQVNA